MLRCERIETALRDRVWTMPHRPGERRWNGLLLRSGGAVIEDQTSQFWLDPMMIFLSPADAAQSMRILAGSEGILFVFNETQATTAVGRSADAEAFVQLLENSVLVRLESDDISISEVEFALSLVSDRPRSAGLGHETLLDAALKIVLVSVLRNLPDSFNIQKASDRSTQLLHRFRHLLETGFRDQWSVVRYAEALGIGADRLHDLCTAKLGKPPSSLIRERMNYEAKLLLRNSAAPVADISARLGFRDPSSFSRFFTAMNDESPRSFRNQASTAPTPGAGTTISFSDWP